MNLKCLWVLLFLMNFLHVSAEKNAAARYEIDAKRAGVNPTDKDALPRSREFIRLDSTYYVGYMYEGMYKADRSSDYFGYHNSIAPVKKAFLLLQKDYGLNLKSMYTSPQAYMQLMSKYVDFLQLANTLRECYDNIEMPDSSMWVIDAVGKYNFPKDHLGVYTIKAWTYHRNRFFNNQKFSFLKNSVEENEKAAFSYCYFALGRINRYKAQNDLWFGPGQAESDKLNVYHYLALLHCYNKNYDSSEYYYERLAAGNMVSWNNYGNMKHEVGEFAQALTFLDRDKFKYTQKMLREPFYYIPMLDVYAGRTKEAMELSKLAIANAGSTPGFGWYNLALTRSYLYDGQLDSAEYALEKAAGFKEIHIGTTLTQSQYEFTVNVLRLQLIERKAALLKFENTGWWYSPVSLYNSISLFVKEKLLEYVLINQLSANPERDRTVYDLFCGESTTTFDETFYLLKDFSAAYFEKKYKGYQDKDQRRNLSRYFKLFEHKMQWINGEEDEARAGYRQLAKEVLLDTANEKLFLARLYEGLATGSKGESERDYNFYSNALYEEYPQLVPFTGVTLKMKLNTTGVSDETTKAVVRQVMHCNIDWVDEADANTAIANVLFVKKGDRYEATIHVKSGSDKVIVAGERMIFKDTAGAGRELALRLFGKSGALVYEKPAG